MTTARHPDEHDDQCVCDRCAWSPETLRGKPANTCPLCHQPIDDHGLASVACKLRWR